MNIQYGAGVLFATPNGVGNQASDVSPQQFPVLQDVTVTFKGSLKKLYGQTQMPVAAARGKVDVTGKGKIIVPSPALLAEIYFGLNTTIGGQRIVFGESHTMGISVVATHATANVDRGVLNGTTGLAMRQMPSGTAQATLTVGQYSFSSTTGAYSFATGETASTVILNYEWPDTTLTSLTVTNQLMGYAPQLQMVLFSSFRNKQFSIQLNACIIGQFSIPTKQEDFWIADFDFEAVCDAASVLGIITADS